MFSSEGFVLPGKGSVLDRRLSCWIQISLPNEAIRMACCGITHEVGLRRSNQRNLLGHRGATKVGQALRAFSKLQFSPATQQGHRWAKMQRSLQDRNPHHDHTSKSPQKRS